MGLPAGLADDVADLFPDRGLGDEIDVGIGIGLPALAFQDAAGLAAAGIVAGARHRLAKRNPFAKLAVFLQRAMGEPLLIAHLDACEVEHAVLHGGGDLLSLAGDGALIERGDDAERQMQPGAAVADLRAGDERQSVAESGGRCRTAGALRDVLIHLAILKGTRTETLDRGHDQFRIDALDLLPGKSHAVEHARPEVFHQHVAALDQRGQDFLALRVLGVERDRALVVVEHGEIQAVDVRHVLQLTARDIADARALDLDNVGAEPRQQLRAGRSRLDVGEIENANALQRLGHMYSPTKYEKRCRDARQRGHPVVSAGYFFFSLLCGLRLPIRPLSLPAAGSSTALIRVGLPEFMAASTARLSSSGVVALTPTPPKASIILSSVSYTHLRAHETGR